MSDNLSSYPAHARVLGSIHSAVRDGADTTHATTSVEARGPIHVIHEYAHTSGSDTLLYAEDTLYRWKGAALSNFADLAIEQNTHARQDADTHRQTHGASHTPPYDPTYTTKAWTTQDSPLNAEIQRAGGETLLAHMRPVHEALEIVSGYTALRVSGTLDAMSIEEDREQGRTLAKIAVSSEGIVWQPTDAPRRQFSIDQIPEVAKGVEDWGATMAVAVQKTPEMIQALGQAEALHLHGVMQDANTRAPQARVADVYATQSGYQILSLNAEGANFDVHTRTFTHPTPSDMGDRPLMRRGIHTEAFPLVADAVILKEGPSEVQRHPTASAATQAYAQATAFADQMYVSLHPDQASLRDNTDPHTIVLSTTLNRLRQEGRLQIQPDVDTLQLTLPSTDARAPNTSLGTVSFGQDGALYTPTGYASTWSKEAKAESAVLQPVRPDLLADKLVRIVSEIETTPQSVEKNLQDFVLTDAALRSKTGDLQAHGKTAMALAPALREDQHEGRLPEVPRSIRSSLAYWDLRAQGRGNIPATIASFKERHTAKTGRADDGRE